MPRDYGYANFTNFTLRKESTSRNARLQSAMRHYDDKEQVSLWAEEDFRPLTSSPLDHKLDDDVSDDEKTDNENFYHKYLNLREDNLYQEIGITSSTGTTVIYQNDSYRSSSEERSVSLELTEPEKRNCEELYENGKYSPHKKFKMTDNYEVSKFGDKDLKLFQNIPVAKKNKRNLSNPYQLPALSNYAQKGVVVKPIKENDLQDSTGKDKQIIAKDVNDDLEYEGVNTGNNNRNTRKADPNRRLRMNIDNRASTKPESKGQKLTQKSYETRMENNKFVEKSEKRVTRPRFNVSDIFGNNLKEKHASNPNSSDKMKSRSIEKYKQQNRSPKSEEFSYYTNDPSKSVMPKPRSQIIKIPSFEELKSLYNETCSSRSYEKNVGHMPSDNSEDSEYNSDSNHGKTNESPKTAPGELATSEGDKYEYFWPESDRSKSNDAEKLEKKSGKTFPNSCLKTSSSHSAGARTKSSVRFVLDQVNTNSDRDMAKKSARMEPYPIGSESSKAKGDSNEGSLENVQDHTDNVSSEEQVSSSGQSNEDTIENDTSAIIALYCIDELKSGVSENLVSSNQNNKLQNSSRVDENPSKNVQSANRKRTEPVNNKVTGRNKTEQNPNPPLKKEGKPLSKHLSLEAKKKEIRQKLEQLNEHMKQTNSKPSSPSIQSKPSSPQKPIWKPISPSGSVIGRKQLSPVPKRTTAKRPTSPIPIKPKEEPKYGISPFSSPQRFSGKNLSRKEFSNGNSSCPISNVSIVPISSSSSGITSTPPLTTDGSCNNIVDGTTIESGNVRPKTSDGSFRSYPERNSRRMSRPKVRQEPRSAGRSIGNATNSVTIKRVNISRIPSPPPRERPTSRKPHLSPSRPQSEQIQRSSPSASPRTNFTLQKSSPNADYIKSTILEELSLDTNYEHNTKKDEKTECSESIVSKPSSPQQYNPPESPAAVSKSKKIGHPLRNKTLEEFQNSRNIRLPQGSESFKNSTSSQNEKQGGYKPPWMRNGNEIKMKAQNPNTRRSLSPKLSQSPTNQKNSENNKPSNQQDS